MKETTKTNETAKVRGILTGAMYGTSKFDKDEKYHVSIKFDDGERDKLVAACNDIYKNAGSFTPKWFKDDTTEYVNFKSNYDIPCVYKDDDGNRHDAPLSAILSEFGTISGSKVIIAVTLKEGAIYPKAIAFTELVKASIDDLFDEDELPFT